MLGPLAHACRSSSSSLHHLILRSSPTRTLLQRRSITALRRIADVRDLRSSQGRQLRVGLVPTMGALHDGHLDLALRARGEVDFLFGSIFVNPAQFGPGDDLDAYPRTFDEDMARFDSVGVDAVFCPAVKEMYPDFDAADPAASANPQDAAATRVVPSNTDADGEGAARPGFFTGVSTVVTKLFNIVQPDKAYFGQKDGMQCIVIRSIVRDLNMPVEVVVCDTVREPDGLAMSSRNAYMSAEQRAVAPVLYEALRAVQDRWDRGQRHGLREAADEALAPAKHMLDLEYLSMADNDTGRALGDGEAARGEGAGGGGGGARDVMVSAAVRFKTQSDVPGAPPKLRLIDNIVLRSSGGKM